MFKFKWLYIFLYKGLWFGVNGRRQTATGMAKGTTDKGGEGDDASSPSFDDLPRDLHLRICMAMDMDARIRSRLVFKLRVPDSVTARLAAALKRPDCVSLGIGIAATLCLPGPDAPMYIIRRFICRSTCEVVRASTCAQDLVIWKSTDAAHRPCKMYKFDDAKNAWSEGYVFG